MIRTRTFTMLAAPALLLIVAACSPAAPTPTPDGGNGGTEATATATATATAEGGGNGGGSTGDVSALLEQLVPPSSTEIARNEVEGGVTAAYNTASSMDDLRSFYEGRIDDLGLDVVNTTDQEGQLSWLFGGTGGSVGGLVTVSSSDNQTVVSVTLGTSQ